MFRRFLVHGSKVWLCQIGGQPEDDQRQWMIRTGMLPDFPDSEVSRPQHKWEEWQREEPAEREEWVRPRRKSPLEVPDEALRMNIRTNNGEEPAPQWLEVEDEMIVEKMSEDETDWRIRDWLSRSVQLQDTVLVHDQVVEEDLDEPMMHANHCASDKQARERMWRHAQWQSDRDGRPTTPPTHE